MSPSATIPTKLTLLIAGGLLCAASVAGCNRTITVPPLVEKQGSPQIPGKFVWHHLLTGDGEAARKFYGGLFGWEFDVHDDGRYSVITHQGMNLGGILDTSKDGNVPKAGHWLSAISTPNIEASLAAVEEAGGKQLEAPIDVPGVGRVVTVEDADGAVLHLLSSPNGDPPDVEPPIYTWLWHELLANRVDRAVEFYHSVFGYRIEPLKNNPRLDCHFLWSSGEARAGILRNPFENARSAWIPYVRVDDPAALAQRVAELGGRVVVGPRQDLRHGTLAFIVDPSGAPLALQKWPPDMEANR